MILAPFIRTVKIDSPAADVNLSTLVGTRAAGYMMVFATIIAVGAFDAGTGWQNSGIFVSAPSITAPSGVDGLGGVGGTQGYGNPFYTGAAGYGGNGTPGGAGTNGKTPFKTTVPLTLSAATKTFTRGIAGRGGGGGGGGGYGDTHSLFPSQHHYGGFGGRGQGRDGAAAAGTAGETSPNYAAANGAAGGAFNTAGTNAPSGGAGGLGGAAGAAGIDGKALEGVALIRFIGAQPTYVGTVT